MTNPEAVEWLESQPIDLGAAITHYQQAGDRGAILRLSMFSFKDDHEGISSGRCYECDDDLDDTDREVIVSDYDD